MLRQGLAIAGLVVVLDQLTKWAILTWLERAITLTPFFNLVVVWNRGVSFGMFDSAGGLGPWFSPGWRSRWWCCCSAGCAA